MYGTGSLISEDGHQAGGPGREDVAVQGPRPLLVNSLLPLAGQSLLNEDLQLIG